MSPCLGKSLVVSSYTHPEYAISMADANFAAAHEVQLAGAFLLAKFVDAAKRTRMKDV